MLPRGMQVADLNRKRKRRRARNRTDGRRRTDNDPLQSYDGDAVNLDGVEGDEGEEARVFRVFRRGDQGPKSDKRRVLILRKGGVQH